MARRPAMPTTSKMPKPAAGLRIPAWLVAVAMAWIFIGWSTARRIERVERVSDLAAEGSSAAAARGPRNLIVPERNENTFEWILQTQQMLSGGPARIRHVDYDNAPFGREVMAPSPYRWWLAVAAWLDHLLSGHSAAAAVEYGALLADPLLLMLALPVLGSLVSRRFGPGPAIATVGGLAGIFPVAAAFVPGVADVRGLTVILLAHQAVCLAGGLDARLDPRSRRRWFAVAGVIGGVGLWINVSVAVPILAGLFVGAILALMRSKPIERVAADGGERCRPWRVWSITGGATVLLAYLVEFAPGHLGDWRLDAVHPVYGIAWVGLGELLARLEEWKRGRRRSLRAASIGAIALAIAAVLLPVVIGMTAGRPTWTARDLLWARLDSLPGGVTAANLAAWFARDGVTAMLWATLLPAFVLIPAIIGWIGTPRDSDRRLAITVLLGATVTAGVIACRQLSWWGYFDAMAIVLAAVTLEGGRPGIRRAMAALVAVAAFLGIWQAWPPGTGTGEIRLTASESEELVERHVARWLAAQAGEGGAVVFAPPHFTTTLCYYGGLRGLGTFAPGNQAGFSTSLAIAGVTTMEEVEELLRGRGVRYLVFPSWDPFFDDFARLYLAGKYAHRTSFLASELRHWNLPPWLRPIPYQLPVAGDFTGQSVAIFEVVDEQSPAVAAGRLAEYFVETDDLDRATATADTLRRFPGEVSALTAQAQVQLARNDHDGLARTIEALDARLAAGGDRYLPWDRRVSLAMVLARGGKMEGAQAQLRRCVADVNDERLRSLTTGSLLGWQMLLKAFHLEIADERLRKLARDLLPAALRERL
jgi:hypothetical protein